MSYTVGVFPLSLDPRGSVGLTPSLADDCDTAAIARCFAPMKLTLAGGFALAGDYRAIPCDIAA